LVVVTHPKTQIEHLEWSAILLDGEILVGMPFDGGRVDQVLDLRPIGFRDEIGLTGRGRCRDGTG
jgi:hypothetical protein